MQAGDVCRGVGEVGRVPEVSPTVPTRRVVGAGEADGHWREVGASHRELDRVVGAEGHTRRDDALRAAHLLVDPGHDRVGEPLVVTAVPAGSLLGGLRVVRPGVVVHGVNAEEAGATALDELTDRIEHAVARVIDR